MANVNDMFRYVSERTGLTRLEVETIVSYGKPHVYAPGDWLFHESTPRRWGGLVLEGDVDIVSGLHGSTQHLAVLSSGALVSEGAFLDDLPHANGAFTRHGAEIWQMERDQIERFRQENPALFYRLTARIASGISARLRVLSKHQAGNGNPAVLLGKIRRETDSLGERELPEEAYYGVQTLRAMENFDISGIPVRKFEHMIEGLAMVKKAAAQTNHELDEIEVHKRDVICQVCDELLSGRHHEHFTVDMFQGGAGTSTNMNANEVIANRGLEILNKPKGAYGFLHPNDDVNCSQSTNDAYPTAVKLAVLLSLKDLLTGLNELREALAEKASEFADVLKMGRTENQDAVPMTLGQEFGAYAVMIESAESTLTRAAEVLFDINMGATAIGTGINSPPGYGDLVTRKLREISGFPLKQSRNLVEATQNAGSFVQMSGAMKLAAVQISKICNDLRWLSSGPRCGLNELNLPPMQPGSSIMPGKVNPVIPEVVNQVCYQIIGYDAAVSMAAEASELELCMAEPVIAYDLLHGMLILKNACVTLASRCITGITANRAVCRQYVENSIGLVTALNPVLGYEKSAAIAKEALKTGASVYDLVLEKKWLTRAKLDDLLKPENMTDPRKVPK